MGATADPRTARTIVQFLRGQDLHEAWVENGSPGTWGNVLRRAKAAAQGAPASASANAAASAAGEDGAATDGSGARCVRHWRRLVVTVRREAPRYGRV